jgi:uncharacterized repeat protein (TIGR02543 family)
MKIFKYKYFFVFLLILTFSACNNPYLSRSEGGFDRFSNQEHINYHTVIFEPNGGEPAPGNQRIAHNRRVAKVQTITRENYGFGGWFTDRGFTREWNFATDRVTRDMTLYAKWGFPYHIVKFEVNGGNPELESLRILEGAKIPEPPVLRKAVSVGSGNFYGFGGWYKESDLINQWDFSTDTMGAYDITLYAKWEEAHCLVSFETNGGTPVPRNQDLVHGAKIVEPFAMSKSGYGFGGWYKEPNFINQWDFANDTVSIETSAITLYARWVSIVAPSAMVVNCWRAL